MEITSAKFMLLVMVCAYVFNATCFISVRMWTLALFNLIFIASYFNNFIQTIPLVIFIVSGYLLLKISYKKQYKIIATAGIVVLISAFIYLKGFPIASNLPGLPFNYVVVGISYILFRIIHLSLDASSGDLKEKISPIMYFNYICSFFTLLSGPIQKYRDFSQQLMSSAEPKAAGFDMMAAISRVTDGFFKILVVSFLFSTFHKKAIEKTFDAGHSGGIFFVISFSFAAAFFLINMYFNFSGYMDIMIGLGRFFGLSLPENFNKPFAAKNFLDFWTKWHITLTQWFRAYMFFPLLKRMMKGIQNRQIRPYSYVFATFVTFIVIGAWHGTIYVGIFLAIGTSVNKMYEIELKKRLSVEKQRALSKNSLVLLINQGLVFGYISFSTICLAMNIDDYLGILKGLGFFGASLSILFMSAAASFFFLIVNATKKVFSSAAEKIESINSPKISAQLWLTAKILFISLLIVSKLTIVPPFIYQAF